jgi:hypothetical protein
LSDISDLENSFQEVRIKSNNKGLGHLLQISSSEIDLGDILLSEIRSKDVQITNKTKSEIHVQVKPERIELGFPQLDESRCFKIEPFSAFELKVVFQGKLQGKKYGVLGFNFFDLSGLPVKQESVSIKAEVFQPSLAVQEEELRY